jgi:hypothetical protein
MFKDDLPSKAEIVDYWKDKIFKLGLFVDWGEPSCWVCGFHYGNKYDIKRTNAGWEEVLRCWNAIPLQRCHIVPRSLGGSNIPDNLFLMCKECHDLAPNTNIPEIFFQWANTQSWYRREMNRIREALTSFGIEEDNYDLIMEIVKSSEFRQWVSKRMGIHLPQSRYASRSFRLTLSTIVGLAQYYMNNIKKRHNDS